MSFTVTIFIVNVVLAIALSVMGFFVLFRNTELKINRIFAIMTILMAMWITTSATSDLTQNIYTAELLARFAIFGPLLFLPLLWSFIHHFPKEQKPMVHWKVIVIFIPFFITAPLVFSKYNIESVVKKGWGTDFTPGHLYTLLLLFIIATIIYSSKVLATKFHASKNSEEKAQMKFLFTGFLLMLVVGTIMNLILPAVGVSEFSTIGPALATSVFAMFAAYAIVKHHLLDVKVIAAEFFGAILSFTTFVQIFSAQTTQDYIFRVIGFLIIAFFSVLMVRSVLREVEQRQEVQKLAKELQSRNVQLKKLNTLKTTMVGIASHQLRGPLGGMRGYLTMFKDGDLGPLTDKQKDIVKMNLSTLSRLLNAVETFLDITKIEAGKMVLRKEVLPLDDAVRDVAHEFEIMLLKKGLTLKTDIEEHVWVDFDPEKIKHVVFNLVDNAMKYTDEGSITVTLHRDAGEAVIMVTDTGRGVLKQDLPKLFGRFERGELAVDRGGSGLGLYIVKMLTEMQGGKVDVTSPGEGKGTTFHVRLPLSKEHH